MISSPLFLPSQMTKSTMSRLKNSLMVWLKVERANHTAKGNQQERKTRTTVPTMSVVLKTITRNISHFNMYHLLSPPLFGLLYLHLPPGILRSLVPLQVHHLPAAFSPQLDHHLHQKYYFSAQTLTLVLSLSSLLLLMDLILTAMAM